MEQIISENEGLQMLWSPFSKDGLSVEFTPSNRKTIRKITVSIEGQFTLVNTKAAFRRIMHAFDHFDHVSVVLKNIAYIDLAAIQWLYKMKYTQENKGKVISLTSEFPKEYRDLISVSGLLPLVNNSKLIA